MCGGIAGLCGGVASEALTFCTGTCTPLASCFEHIGQGVLDCLGTIDLSGCGDMCSSGFGSVAEAAEGACNSCAAVPSLLSNCGDGLGSCVGALGSCAESAGGCFQGAGEAAGGVLDAVGSIDC